MMEMNWLHFVTIILFIVGFVINFTSADKRVVVFFYSLPAGVGTGYALNVILTAHGYTEIFGLSLK